MTTTPSPLYQLDAETLGYAIERLLRQTALCSNRSLTNAARAFLRDAGINVAAISAQELEVIFRNVGRGYAEPSPTRKRKETTQAVGWTHALCRRATAGRAHLGRNAARAANAGTE